MILKRNPVPEKELAIETFGHLRFAHPFEITLQVNEKTSVMLRKVQEDNETVVENGVFLYMNEVIELLRYINTRFKYEKDFLEKIEIAHFDIEKDNLLQKRNLYVYIYIYLEEKIIFTKYINDFIFFFIVHLNVLLFDNVHMLRRIFLLGGGTFCHNNS